jgi:hypothetical protein
MTGRSPQAKIMLGFVVRRCAVALGRQPTPAELAEWANNQRDALGRYRIFGKAITTHDAEVIMKHPGRMVSVRDLEPGFSGRVA